MNRRLFIKLAAWLGIALSIQPRKMAAEKLPHIVYLSFVSHGGEIEMQAAWTFPAQMGLDSTFG